MKTTDIKEIEALASGFVDGEPSYISLDRRDYEAARSRLGDPVLAVETGYGSSGPLAESVRQSVADEDLTPIKEILLFVTTPKGEGAVSMEDIQSIRTIFSEKLPEVRIRLSITVSEDNKTGVSLIFFGRPQP